MFLALTTKRDFLATHSYNYHPNNCMKDQNHKKAKLKNEKPKNKGAAASSIVQAIQKMSKTYFNTLYL